jgi:uncharacterized RDD family membrane protein YckC
MEDFKNISKENPIQEDDLFIAPTFLRFVNYLIDQVAITSIVSLLVKLPKETTISDLVHNNEFAFTSMAVMMVYYFLFEAVFGQTLGKFITRTHVVDDYGDKPTLWMILKRTLCRFIPFEAVSFLFKTIGWHDSISDTLVVMKRK